MENAVDRFNDIFSIRPTEKSEAVQVGFALTEVGKDTDGTSLFKLRVTPEARKAIEEAAGSTGCSFDTYVRCAVMVALMTYGVDERKRAYEAEMEAGKLEAKGRKGRK